MQTDVAKLHFQLKQRDADLTMEIAKVKDLIRQNESLKEQLKSEQRAVKDEEIVRAATARMLDQEQKQREDLEQSLGTERKKREVSNTEEIY